MEISVRDRDEVWSSDNFKLGVARAIHYRPPEEVNPEEQLYAAYLEVVSYELGDDLFVPAEFLGEREASNSRLTLKVPLKVVMKRTWWRAPEFVAKGLGREVRLETVSDEAEPLIPHSDRDTPQSAPAAGGGAR
ncbi:MAG: hypothetical protein ACOC9E_01275 [Chloroflexota bacterium]